MLIGDMPLPALLEHALLPMVALNVMIVAFYILWVIRIWPGLSRQEAVIYAPLAVPLTFLIFFVGVTRLGMGQPLGPVLAPLAVVTGIPWLAGVAAGAITYARVKRGRD